jgi:hypothetical protein
MSFIRQNPALVIGISLPFIFIAILVAAVVYPSLAITPAHDFLYITDSYQNYPGSPTMYKNKFVVQNGKLALQPIMTVASPAVSVPPAPAPVSASPANATTVADEPPLFLYDVTTKSSHEISLADAEQLSLDPGPTSPDGYTIQYEYGNDGFFGLFGGDTNSQGYFISKGESSRRLTGLGDTSMYANDFQLVGWVQ